MPGPRTPCAAFWALFRGGTPAKLGPESPAAWVGAGRVMPGAQQGLSALWQGVGGQASRSLMDHFAEILFALNKHCFSYLSVWIKEAMQQDGFPSARVSPEQKETFSQQILRFVHPSLWWPCATCSGNDPPARPAACLPLHVCPLPLS